MTGFYIALIVLYTLGAALTVNQAGKPRLPLTRAQVVTIVLIDIAVIAWAVYGLARG